MRTYFTNLPTIAWALIALPALMITQTVAATVVPHIVRAVVPDVVRTVLCLM